VSDGFLVRCPICGSETQTGATPLRDGWPTCHGVSMRLVDVDEFVAHIHEQMQACLGVDVSILVLNADELTETHA